MYATLQLLISSIFFFSHYFIVTLLIKNSGKAKKRLILRSEIVRDMDLGTCFNNYNRNNFLRDLVK